MSNALIISGELNDMREFWQDDLNTDIDEVNAFMLWAVNQHRAFAKKDLEIDDVTLDELLDQEIKYQVEYMIASDDDKPLRDYKSVAIALFRYYLIVYKDVKRNELTFEDLEILNQFNNLGDK